MATTTLKQHIPIFVSSTYEDMVVYREAVRAAINDLEHFAKGMELFGSSPETPLEKCLDEVKNCSLYICLIGMRYGSREEKSGYSYTYLEYKEAFDNNIPVLAYILSDDVPILPKYVDKGNSAQLLEEFKDVLKRRHVVSHFNTPSDLKWRVTRDIIGALDKINNIEMDKGQLLDVSNHSSIELTKKFFQRPQKYHSREVDLTIKIKSFSYSFYNDFVQKLGLSPGDIISVHADILDEMGNVATGGYFYTHGTPADKLENHVIGDILRVKVELKHITYQFVQEHDKGKLLEVKSVAVLVVRDIID